MHWNEAPLKPRTHIFITFLNHLHWPLKNHQFCLSNTLHFWKNAFLQDKHFIYNLNIQSFYAKTGPKLKNGLRTIWGSNGLKFKNGEPGTLFQCSYKKKWVYPWTFSSSKQWNLHCCHPCLETPISLSSSLALSEALSRERLHVLSAHLIWPEVLMMQLTKDSSIKLEFQGLKPHLRK